MDWMDKVAAISRLAGMGPALRMRADRTWYVDVMITIVRSHGGLETGGVEHGATPEDAVEEWWRTHVVDLPDGHGLRCPFRGDRLWTWVPAVGWVEKDAVIA